MRIKTSGKDLPDLKADLAVCFAYEGDRSPRAVHDATLRRELAAQMKAEEFHGQPGDGVVWNANGRYQSRRFLVLGLGTPNGDSGEALRIGCARAVRAAARFAGRKLAIRLPDCTAGSIAQQGRAAAEGVRLGAYRFDKYLNDPWRKPVRLETAELSAEGPPTGFRKAVGLGDLGADAVCLARDLVNEAPSRLDPDALARRASSEARKAGLRAKVYGKVELQKLGLQALLAVSRGSPRQPRVVHLTYKPKSPSRSKTKILLVGKGVTFDSGGLNLKPGDSMLTMKSDMGGAAAVLAAMTALGSVGCRVEVHALLGLVENMTGGAAYKPGDILDSWAGKTIEIGNTDAEGRLVMCDLLAWGASKFKPTKVVDVATLTGACVVALGLRATGVFTRHDDMRDALLEAGAAAGEKLWPLPMYEEYLQLLQKGPADLRNIGGRWGGAITAALFLGEFLPRELAWAHLDIAGPSFTETELPEAAEGGTGAGALTLIRWLESVR